MHIIFLHLHYKGLYLFQIAAIYGWFGHLIKEPINHKGRPQQTRSLMPNFKAHEGLTVSQRYTVILVPGQERMLECFGGVIPVCGFELRYFLKEVLGQSC
jgi:hypothetical protein